MVETLSCIEKKEQRIQQLKRWIDNNAQFICLSDKLQIVINVSGDNVVGEFNKIKGM